MVGWKKNTSTHLNWWLDKGTCSEKNHLKQQKCGIIIPGVIQTIESQPKGLKIDKSLGENQKNKTNGFDRGNFGNNTSYIVDAKENVKKRKTRVRMEGRSETAYV